MPDLCRKIPLLCVHKHEFFLPNSPFWRFLTSENESAYRLCTSLHGHFYAHRTISNPSDNGINSRLQIFAIAVANVCDGGCKRLRPNSHMLKSLPKIINYQDVGIRKLGNSMFRIILSLGEGIKGTAHMSIFSPSQHR